MFTQRLSTGMALIAITTLALSACGNTPGSEDAADYTDEAISAADAIGIDLDDCPVDVSKPFDATAKVGATVPLSGGPASAYAVVADGLKAAFAEGNADYDLETEFELLIADDQFLPDKAAAAVLEFVQKDDVVAMTGTTGTQAAVAFRDTTNKECLPAIGIPASGSMVTDPEYPWMVQSVMSVPLDTRIWIENVNETYPDGAKIAVLTTNSETGEDYVKQIDRWLEETESPSEIVVSETVESAEAGAPSSQVTTMRESDADVLLTAPSGAQCITLLQEMANQGWKPATYVTTNCASLTLMGAAGEAADGVMLSRVYMDPNVPSEKGNPGLIAAQETITEYAPGADNENATTLAGYMFADMFMRVARAASESELGLSRLGMIVAARNLDYHPSVFLDGVDVKLDGLDDIYAVESGRLDTYNGVDNTFEPVQVYSFDGELTS